MQWEENFKAMMCELGKDAKISDLWSMSALLGICPTDVKEHENKNTKVVSYTTNKAEQTRG